MQRQEQSCHLDEQCSQVQEGSISERNSFKNIATTKLTKQENDFKLPESLALGKNLLLQNNTQSEFDSDSNNSELSFEERLHFDYGNILSQKLRNYFEAKGLLEKTEVFDWNHQKKSFEVMREIQERSIEQIQRKWGNQQVQKIKYVIKFLKRQQDLAKIYFSVMKVLTLPLVTSGYFLLKQTLAFYLTGRQYFKTQSANVDPVSIRRYAFENYLKVCEQIMNDQKLSQIHYVEHNEYLKTMFEELIFSWLQGFFMCKEGYGRDKVDNRKKTLSGRLRAIQQSEVIQKHKKIKKS